MGGATLTSAAVSIDGITKVLTVETIKATVEDVAVRTSFAVQVGGTFTTNGAVSIDGIVENITFEAIPAIVERVAGSTTLAVQVGCTRILSYLKETITNAAVSIDRKADEFLTAFTIIAIAENVTVSPPFAVKVGGAFTTNATVTIDGVYN